MKESYTMTIAGLQRSLPLCPISDTLKIGAFVIFGDPELTTACAEALNRRCPEHDVLITADGCRFLGEERIPIRPADIEAFMAQ